MTIGKIVLSKSLKPVYEALSYTWGFATDLDYFYVQENEGEKALAITQNLAEALRYLRYKDRPRVLWIDAICVDQNNTAERGHQVLRMADIYRQASRVIIWLGPERDDSALAMQELNVLGSTIEVDWSTYLIKPLSGFKRLWIWQEVRLANTGALIICGTECMLWHIFRNAITCLYHKQSNSLQLEQLMNVCNYHQSPSRLGDLLYRTRYAQCSDERDRVYAILNISSDFSRFEPDYSKTTRDVFKSVVLAYASKKDLTVLSQCEMRENKEAGVPSWVPDWTMRKERRRLAHVRACSGTAA